MGEGIVIILFKINFKIYFVAGSDIPDYTVGLPGVPDYQSPSKYTQIHSRCTRLPSKYVYPIIQLVYGIPYSPVNIPDYPVSVPADYRVGIPDYRVVILDYPGLPIHAMVPASVQ